MPASRPDRAGPARSRGRAGFAVVRVTLGYTDVAATLDALGLDRDRSRVRLLSFQELVPVAARTLLGSGIVLAQRRSVDGPTAATVLLCPCHPQLFPSGWQHGGGGPEHRYEVYDEVSADRVLHAAALTTLARSPGPPPGLTARQRAFLAACAPRPVDCTRLAPLVPIPVTRWPLPWAGLRVAVERWLVPGGPDLLELSLRTRARDARLVQAALLAALPDRRPVADRTATEIAVEHLSSARP